MRVYVEGVGLCGPGLGGWAASRPVLAGAERYVAAPAVVPPSALLPANERRRTVLTVKLAMAVGAEAFANAGRDPAETATVFTSSGGDGETLHGILSGLASDEREISPTRFHNSVHNAPAGYWSIATRSHAPSSSLCAFDASFGAGLLEAASQATAEERAVGLIAYDLSYPEPLHSVRAVGALFGLGLVLTPWPTQMSLASIDVAPRRAAGNPSPMADEALEALRRSTPAARSLPLLAALARREPASIVLDYLPDLELRLSLEPVAAGLLGIRDDRPPIAARE
ncbi:MAG TPA: beta-ketoacyl synthase chain length factor [Stellaceae bacterium]|nr:beta-ketoacyl synthase chain length factor [Stellaceae bacterium]